LKIIPNQIFSHMYLVVILKNVSYKLHIRIINICGALGLNMDFKGFCVCTLYLARFGFPGPLSAFSVCRGLYEISWNYVGRQVNWAHSRHPLPISRLCHYSLSRSFPLAFLSPGTCLRGTVTQNAYIVGIVLKYEFIL